MICKKCLIDKGITEFYKHPGTKEGTLHICKECKKEYARKNRNPEKYRLERWTKPQRRLINVYNKMMSRCYDKNNNRYKWYGGKGIKVLRKNRKEFYRDMTESYIEHREKNGKINNRKTQLDRIDNNGNYCKDNCRWVTAKENSNNRREDMIFHRGLEHHNSRGVLLYDNTGNIIKEFETITDAAMYTGKSITQILRYCRGEVKKPKYIVKFS